MFHRGALKCQIQPSNICTKIISWQVEWQIWSQATFGRCCPRTKKNTCWWCQDIYEELSSLVLCLDSQTHNEHERPKIRRLWCTKICWLIGAAREQRYPRDQQEIELLTELGNKMGAMEGFITSKKVYPDISNVHSKPLKLFCNWAVLAPRNEMIDSINIQFLNFTLTEERTCLSIDLTA